MSRLRPRAFAVEILGAAAANAQRRLARRVVANALAKCGDEGVAHQKRGMSGARHPALHVRAAPFGAALERRHRLAGIEDAVGIEGALHVVEGGELGRAELHAHLPQLLDAHAVLAGDRAAHLDAKLEDAPAELLAALKLAEAC